MPEGLPDRRFHVDHTNHQSYDLASEQQGAAVKIQLTDRQLAKISKPVKGTGGFQSLLRKIQKQIQGDVLEASEVDVERLIHYSFDYEQGEFQEQAKTAADSGTK